MRFPEWLYKLLPGDAGTQQLTALWKESSDSQAAGTVTTEAYTVPNDKCLVLTNAVAKGTAGAAQNANRMRIFIDRDQGTTRYELAVLGAGSVAPPAFALINWSGEVIVPPGATVECEGVYSAGAVANTTALEIFGYLIPRGSVVFG